MKKLSFSCLFVLLVTVFALTGCNKSSDLDSYASADDVVVVSGSAAEVLSNAGCKATAEGIELSESLQRISGMLYNISGVDIKKAENLPGVDYEHFIFSIRDEESALMAFNLTNQDAFVSYLEKPENGFKSSKDGGYTVFVADQLKSLFVKDNVAFMFFSSVYGEATAANLDAYLKKSAETPLEGWQKDALAGDKGINAIINFNKYFELFGELTQFDISKFNFPSFTADFEKWKDGFGKYTLSLDGTKFKMEYTMLDKDGKPLKLDFKCPNVDASLLRYTTADDLAVAIFAIPEDIDWDSVIRGMLEMADEPMPANDEILKSFTDVMNSINGSVMLAGGPTDMSAFGSFKGWHIVLAAQMKEGAAENYVQMLHQMIAQMPYAEFGELTFSNGVLSITSPQIGKVTANADGNTFVLTYGEPRARGVSAIEAKDFEGANAGIVINVPKDNMFSSLIRLPFGVNLTSMSYSDKPSLTTIEETDANGLFLDNIIKLAAGQN